MKKLVSALLLAASISAGDLSIDPSSILNQVNETQQFRDEAERVIFKPLLDGVAYDSNVLAFEPLKYYDYKQQQAIQCSGDDDIDKHEKEIGNGELSPYKISFTLSLNKKYLEGVSELFRKNSVRIVKGDQHNETGIRIGKLVNPPLKGDKGVFGVDNLIVETTYLLSDGQMNTIDLLFKDYKEQDLGEYLKLSLIGENEEGNIDIFYASGSYYFGFVGGKYMSVHQRNQTPPPVPSSTKGACANDGNYLFNGMHTYAIGKNEVQYLIFGIPYKPDSGYLTKETHAPICPIPFVASEMTYSTVVYLTRAQVQQIKKIGLNVVWIAK